MENINNPSCRQAVLLLPIEFITVLILFMRAQIDFRYQSNGPPFHIFFNAKIQQGRLPTKLCILILCTPAH